ncbi:hypothetical protein AVEN_2695-1 [Araneus ventricosus]|uniref:Uncharacterized protein n=1 Tax=Araneus ventricosus TaxID=182803 RepID=A0A4Y2JWY1_ARAVE|nr:hypothetical protein AVEN_2695-1 [Araneus ventricosus]
MLPVDGRQLENVKGELLRTKEEKKPLTSNYDTTWPGQKRKGKKPKNRNSRLSDMGTMWAGREEPEETEEQRNRRLQSYMSTCW